MHYLLNHNFNSSNQFFISKMIKKIPFYHLYFFIPEKQEFLNKSLSNVDVLQQKDIFYQVHYFNEFTDNKYIILKDHSKFMKLINYYYQSLYSMFLLLNQDIVLNFSIENIEYLYDSVYFCNFFNSISLVTFKKFQIKDIFLKNHTFISLESFMFLFLIHDKERNPLFLKQKRKEILDNFLENQVIFSFFNADFKEWFTNEFFETTNQFIDLPIETLINSLLNNAKKWDVFAISSYFFYLFHNNFLREKGDKQRENIDFINDFCKNKFDIYTIFTPNSKNRIDVSRLLNIVKKTYINQM